MMWPFNKKAEVKEQQFETVLQRLMAAQLASGQAVTPETCMKSPTVQALVTAIARRISSTPVHVYQTSDNNGQETKQKLPRHPVANLLRAPNDYQSSVDYWQDLASCLVRHGKFIAVKGRGQTGPIRKLFPVSPAEVSIQAENISSLESGIKFRIGSEDYPMSKVHYIRGPARDFINGDSTVENIKTAIGIEIACEEYGATFFNNGAMPLIIFKYLQGSKGFRTPEDEEKFVADFQRAFSGGNRNRAMLMPVGIELDTPRIENDKAQFLETRKFYQTVIAGAWGVPQHLVGNLENGHYNNVEQQDKDFTLNVIMPYIRAIESAMERDLLTQEDRNSGVIIRFNMDATLRADYLTRMQGYEIQIRNAMKTPNECREREGDNPSSDPAANRHYYSANLIADGMEPPRRTNEQVNRDDEQTDDPATD